VALLDVALLGVVLLGVALLGVALLGVALLGVALLDVATGWANAGATGRHASNTNATAAQSLGTWYQRITSQTRPCVQTAYGTVATFGC
jgi:hypothetical protein